MSEQAVAAVHKRVRLIAVVMASTFVPAQAWAQDAAALDTSSAPNASNTSSARGIGDIIVTARRQAESLQTIPVAVTALDADALRITQVSNVADVQRSAPGLLVATGAPSGTGFAWVAMRGQGNLNAGLASDPAVGIYIDGVYIPRPSQTLVELNDLARVEVLRGPQGTLFGRNVTGGAINLISADPVNRLEGAAQISYGNYDTIKAGAMLNVPLTKDLAVRGTFDYTHSDGFGYNPLFDLRLRNNKSPNARAKLRWQPGGGDVTITLAGDYSKAEDNGQITNISAVNTLGRIGPARAAALQPFLLNKSTWYESRGTGFAGGPPSYSVTKAYGGSATIEGSLGALDIKSITAYRYSFSDALLDQEGTPIDILTNQSTYTSKQWSEEFQVSGDLTDRWNFIAGAYWSRETGVESAVFSTLGTAPGLNYADVTNKTLGVFGQTYYKLTDRLRIFGGLRWTWDKRSAVLQNLRNINLPSNAALPGGMSNCASVDSRGPGVCRLPLDQKFDYPAFTVGVDYQAAEGLFLYANFSRASHAGGLNLRFGSAPTFAPERVESAEFGFKADMLDRRLRLNIAAYHSWTKDAQRAITGLVDTTPPTVTSGIGNSGDFQIDGVEVEVQARPWEGMEISGNLAYNSGRYDRGSFLEGRVAGGAGYIFDRSQEPLLQLPAVQYSIGATQTVPLSFADLSVHADYAFVGAQSFYTITNDPRDATIAAVENEARELGRVDSYGLLNGRVALQFENPNIELSAFVRNATNKRYVTRSRADQYAVLGISHDYVGEPRMYGVSIRYRFGTE